nr:hypothetical protein [Tanacetum cinerariifolium]
MSPLEYRTILKYRLMILLFSFDVICPVCRKACLGFFGEHAVHYEGKTSSSGSDSSQSSVNSEAIVARENINTTINRDMSLQITNDGGEKNNHLERGRKRKIHSGTMKAVGQPEPIGQAAESFGVSRTTLKRCCREPVNVMGVPASGGVAIVTSVVSDKLDRTSNKPIRKRKRTVLSFGLVKIREHCGKTMEKAVANLGVGISKLRGMCSTLGMQWWSNRKRLKSIQANAVISTSEKEPTSVFAASSEPLVATNITHNRPTVIFHQQQTNLPDRLAQFIENATASAVKKLTIKATYKENMVKFPFTLLDGLEKLKEMVATRFRLRLGSFKLKYVDEDDDMILIACDTDLMLLVGDPRQPINQPVTRLLVLPIAHA